MPNFQLSLFQKQILSFFAKNDFGQSFYWTGGTLLAYFFNHRLSFDLDFFSDDLFSDDEYLNFTNSLKKEIEISKITLNLQKNRRLYLIETPKENLKLELVFFPFPSISERKTIPEFNIKADSIEDIMVNKILSAYQRNEPKDIFDLYCYLTKNPKLNFQELAALVDKKFGITIEQTLLIAKINELAENLALIQPFLFSPPKDMAKTVKNFFQEIFNNLVEQKIKY